MKKLNRKLMTAVIATTLLVATAMTGCNGSKSASDVDSTESVTTESTESAVTNILAYVKGIKDLVVEVNASDVDYLKNVTYDDQYVKEVTVDSSKVDITTVGVYELVYTITPVDTNLEIATIAKTVTVEVITTDDAQAKADNGEVVITDGGETKKASDGTTPTDKSTDDVSSENTTTTTKPSSTSSTQASTQATTPAKQEHTHSWVAVTEIKTVVDSPATTRQELVSAAYDEVVVDEEERYENVIIFNYDDYIPTSQEDAYAHQIMLFESGLESGYHTGTRTIPAVTHTVHHDAVYKAVDVPAVTHTETVTTGYKCSCGATK